VQGAYKPAKPGRRATATGGAPAQGRELRAQGKRTLAKLLSAGLRVFAERGYHVARVDDIVRAARTSHGTFYLYFASKEDLLRALAIECAAEYEALAGDIGEIDSSPEGAAEAERVVSRFFAIYRQYGPVIRAWMEDQVTEREVSRLGVEAFTHIATTFASRLRRVGAPHDDATIGVLMALLERSAYYQVSRASNAGDADAAVTVARTLHRGFFTAAA